MDKVIEMQHINKKYYEGYEEYDYVAFKIKEQDDTALRYHQSQIGSRS